MNNFVRFLKPLKLSFGTFPADLEQRLKAIYPESASAMLIEMNEALVEWEETALEPDFPGKDDANSFLGTLLESILSELNVKWV